MHLHFSFLILSTKGKKKIRVFNLVKYPRVTNFIFISRGGGGLQEFSEIAHHVYGIPSRLYVIKYAGGTIKKIFG